MKFAIVIALAALSLVAAEPPRFRPSARQTAAQSAPYNPRGWRPQGAPFTLPRSQPQQAYGPPSPVASYGPPPEELTTTDFSIGDVTEPPQFGKITAKEDNKKSADVKEGPGAYYVVLPQSAVVLPQPQSQKLVYAVAEVQRSAPLVAVPQATVVAAPLTSERLQALPAPALKAVYSPLTDSYLVYP